MADSKYGGCSSLYFPEDNPIQTLVMGHLHQLPRAPAVRGAPLPSCAREQGLNMVVVDLASRPMWLWPRRVAAHSSGTDVALMMTWIRYIIENKLYDEDFCKRWTNLPYLIDTDTKKMLRAYEVGLGEADAEDGKRRSWCGSEDELREGAAGRTTKRWTRVLRHVRDRRRRIPTAFTLLQERVDEWTLGAASMLLEKDPGGEGHPHLTRRTRRPAWFWAWPPT